MVKKKTSDKQINFTKYLSIILLIISIIILGLTFFINILPNQYLFVLAILISVIDLIIIKFLLSKSVFKNVIGVILAIITIIIMVLGINYELSTVDFFKQFGFNSYKTEHYNIIVLKNGNFKEIDELNNKKIGRLTLDNREGLKEADKKLGKKINFEVYEVEDISDLITNLLSKEIDAILLEDAQLEILSEENEIIYEKLAIIYTIEVELEIKKVGKEVDIIKEPFTIYISGIDTYGSITKVSRSDVNILVTINPKTNKILLTNIPRDYYVNLAEINEKDKLTHAGIYGIETSLKTIENLLDIQINYYVKVNFSSLIKIVDSLDGVNVNSAYDFTTIDGYTFKKGINKLNGEAALSFSRERKAFLEGDRIRGENQTRVLAAIIEKACSSSIIMNYNDLLKALKGSFITNLEDSKIRGFIKKQISNPTIFTVESISLNGTDSSNYTYSYKKNKLYVMEPSIESIESAKSKIKSILNN